MQYRITSLPDRVECEWSGSDKFVMSWSRNRVHFRLRIYRLAFDGADGAPASELDSLSQGVERLVAEVDSDAPWGLYAFADLPGTVTEDLISLMYVPKWLPRK